MSTINHLIRQTMTADAHAGKTMEYYQYCQCPTCCALRGDHPLSGDHRATKHVDPDTGRSVVHPPPIPVDKAREALHLSEQAEWLTEFDRILDEFDLPIGIAAHDALIRSLRAHARKRPA